MKHDDLFRTNRKIAQRIWGELSLSATNNLLELTKRYKFGVATGDLLLIEGKWYVTHAGLLGLSSRKHCSGIYVSPVKNFCDAHAHRWVFRAIVHTDLASKGFMGYGDADPSNITPLVHGAEMRVAETRAVNRALRKAYGIGICSVEEIGSSSRQAPAPDFEKRAQPANGNGNFGGRTVRDRLCQLIRQHQLDAALVKSYATEFCGVKALRDASREQVEKFVAHLSEQAEKDRSALVCQLNSYGGSKAGAA